jgi:hypothetical protein
MYQVTIQLAHMPLRLVCLSNDLIAFARATHFSTVYESCDGYQVCIDEEGISFKLDNLAESFDIQYNSMIEWRDKPTLLKWLQSMQLTQPTF